jgi:hypothetical protein
MKSTTTICKTLHRVKAESLSTAQYAILIYLYPTNMNDTLDTTTRANIRQCFQKVQSRFNMPEVLTKIVQLSTPKTNFLHVYTSTIVIYMYCMCHTCREQRFDGIFSTCIIVQPVTKPLEVYNFFQNSGRLYTSILTRSRVLM